MDKFSDYEAGRLLIWEKEIAESQAKHASEIGAHWTIRAFKEVTSTMDVARELIPNVKDDSPVLVLAQNQSLGRGRQGRRWLTGAEGFYATYLLKISGEISKVYPFPLVVGVSLAESLSQLGCEVMLKWPNDIQDQHGKKIAGVLMELLPEKRGGYLLVGIGVNLKGEPNIISHATSLFSSYGVSIAVTQLAGLLSNKLYSAFQILMQDGFSSFKAEWLARASKLGNEVSVHVGDSIKVGTFLGIEDNGELLLEINGEKVKISSGEVLC